MRWRTLNVQMTKEIEQINTMREQILKIKATTEIKLTSHRDKNIIQFDFPYDKQTINLLRQTFPIKYSNTKKMWYLLDMPQYRNLLNIPLNDNTRDYINTLHTNNHEAWEDYLQLLNIKGYSQNTKKCYSNEFGIFLQTLKSIPADSLNEHRIKAYINYCITTLKLSENTIHSRINALKFYYEQVLKQPNLMLHFPRPKKPSLLPKALSQHELRKLFAAIDNPKHLLIMKLVYGMGLRVSEIVAILISDVDSNRMQVHIRNAKGKKDRYVNLPTTILAELRNYYKYYRPQYYLFEGQAGGQYHTRSVQNIFKTAMIKAGITKTIGVHGLRHSYATHLHESGIDIAFIQELLGHSNIKTTLIYTKVSAQNVRGITSPLDNLND
jgi:integrase/recombinase XerD